MTEPLFTIDVDLQQTHTFSGPQGTVNMILFDGRCECDFFRGRILSGGVDTQLYLHGEPGRLSARYMLEGEDKAGAPARLFIENNGEFGPDGVCVTYPRILTDNPSLTWLCETALTGRIEGRPGGVRICFYASEE